MDSWKERKGDSTDIKKITIKGITDYSGYTGDITVLDPNTKVVAGFTGVITPDVSTGFTVGLSPQQTNALAIGTYLVVFEVKKVEEGTVVYRKELSWSLIITESLINN